MGNKRIHIFPKGISAKVNVIVWLEFEFTYYYAAVQYISHYATPFKLGNEYVEEHVCFMILAHFLLSWTVEFGNSSKSPIGHITRWVRSEIRSPELWRRRVIHGKLGHSIVCMWSSPFPGQWWLTGPGMDIYIYTHTHTPACLVLALGLCWVTPVLFLSANWNASWNL